MSTWNHSPFGSSLKFSTQACLFEVRRIWSLYAQTRTTQQDGEVRHAIKSWYDRYIVEQDGPSIVLNGVRSAGAHRHLVGNTLNKAFHSFWETGVVAGNSLDIATLRQDDGGRVNPLMAVSSFGSFNVHHGLDPLIGFHLAEVFDLPQTPNETMNSLAHLVKSQFSGWCHEFASSVASSTVSIMHHCGDAVNFSHALQAIEGSATLPPSTYFCTKPWSAVPLELPSEMLTRYNVIDTSNIMDHVGLLNLLVATVSLLSGRRDSVLYTESFLEGAHIEPADTTSSIRPPSATVSLKRDGNVQSIGVTNSFAPDSDAGRASKDGGVVKLSQISPCVVAVSIGDLMNTSKFIFPFPVDGAASKMKVAPKSSWIEIKAPTSNALQFGGFNLDPFPVISQGTSSLAWGMGRVDPDLQPLVKISASTPRFLDLLCSMAFNAEELAQIRATSGPRSMPRMIQLKGVVAKISLACAKVYTDGPSDQTRLYIIRYDDTNMFCIISNGLRHDRDTGSIFLDGFFISDTAGFFRQMAIRNNDEGCLEIAASKEDMELWQCLIPALAERCRSWEHSSNCKYKPGSIKSSVCDCGLGRDAEQMPSGYEDVAELAIRIALPFISTVPYVESVVDEKLAARMTAYKATIGQDEKSETSDHVVCDNCGSDKPGLKACSRCEKVKYCNHACQKAAWKKHKKLCKR